MNRPIISVVIPVYNVEAYIERCVNSVRNQTVENIEIILIDDGSPDQSPVLCDRYVEKDRRVRVIHKKNGGLASARNRGITVATGKYIFFLDSDDWLEKDGLQQLYELAQKYQVDFVRYRAFRTEWPGMERNVPCRVETVREMQGGIYDRKRILQEIYPRLLATRQLTLGPVVGAWGALYRTDFLKKNQIFFCEEIKFSEDILFSAKVILCAQRFYYKEEAGIYHYWYNPDSISKSFREGRWESCKKIIEHAVTEFQDRKEYCFEQQLNWLTWFVILVGLNERDQRADRRERKVYCKKLLNDPVVRKCPLKIQELDVPEKQKILLYMIKKNWWWIFSLI